MRQLSLHVVGAAFANRRGGGNRQFEILLSAPGEAVTLVPEPRNPADPQAVAVLSARGVQIGYLTAERAPWIGGMLRSGREISAIFQGATAAGAAIRVAFDGAVPELPIPSAPAGPAADAAAGPLPDADDDPGFWPDDIPPDD